MTIAAGSRGWHTKAMRWSTDPTLGSPLVTEHARQRVGLRFAHGFLQGRTPANTRLCDDRGPFLKETIV